MLYLEELNGVNEYRFESFSLPESCDPQDALMQQRLWFTGQEFTIMQNDVKFDGYKKKEFQNLAANEPVQFVYERDMETMDGKSFDIELEIFGEDSDGFDYEQPAFNQTITVESKPCQWIANAEWEFIPTEDGVYRIVGSAKITGDEPSSNERLIGASIQVERGTDKSILAPLKQLRSGVLPSDIICADSLQLVFKHLDNSPACVKPETKQKLIERGWVRE